MISTKRNAFFLFRKLNRKKEKKRVKKERKKKPKKGAVTLIHAMEKRPNTVKSIENGFTVGRIGPFMGYDDQTTIMVYGEKINRSLCHMRFHIHGLDFVKYSTPQIHPLLESLRCDYKAVML